MPKEKNNIEDDSIKDYLFKLLLYRISKKQQKLIIIFNHDFIVKSSVNMLGNIIKESVHNISILDISQSILVGQPIIEDFFIHDKDKFKRSVEILDIKEYEEDMAEIFNVIHGKISSLRDQMMTLTKVMLGIRFCNQARETDETQGNLVIASNDTGLAHIVFNTISGDTANLQPAEVNKVGHTLMEIILSNIDTDLDNQEKIDKLRAEIEYKIFEVLPSNIKVGNININMDSVLQEIKKHQDNITNEELDIGDNEDVKDIIDDFDDEDEDEDDNDDEDDDNLNKKEIL